MTENKLDKGRDLLDEIDILKTRIDIIENKTAIVDFTCSSDDESNTILMTMELNSLQILAVIDVMKEELLKKQKEFEEL